MVETKDRKTYPRIGSSLTYKLNNNTPTFKAPNYKMHLQSYQTIKTVLRKRGELAQSIQLGCHVNLHNQASAFLGSIKMQVLQIARLNSSH
jgi:hypothetical protein